jgi:hypothetical protein
MCPDSNSVQHEWRDADVAERDAAHANALTRVQNREAEMGVSDEILGWTGEFRAARPRGGARAFALIAAFLVVLAASAVAAADHAASDSAATNAAARVDASRSEASESMVYYGRARMAFVRRPAINSRSSHPAARSPGRCTSRSPRSA